MPYTFFSFIWAHFKHGKIIHTEAGFFFTTFGEPNFARMKHLVRKYFLKDQLASITLHNISQITQAKFGSSV
jgi:hypothetical protein